MNTRNTILPFLVLSLTCLVNQNALAGTVYQWTDESGNINFSDVPPDESVTVEIYEYSINQDGANNIELEPYSIFNQVEQMAQWRRQLAEERLAKRKLYLEEKRLAQELEISRRNETIAAGEYAPRTYYYNPYQFSYRRRHGIDRHPHRIERQPHRIGRHPHRIGRQPHQAHHRSINAPSRRNFIPRRYGPVHL